MKKPVPTRVMREHPDLDQLKRQAKELLEAFRAGDPAAAAEIAAHFEGADDETFALHDAQFVLARAYGFQSWPKLKAYVDGVTATTFKAAIRAGEIDRVRSMLRLRPELVNMNLTAIDDRPLHYAVSARDVNSRFPLCYPLQREGPAGSGGFSASAALWRTGGCFT